MEDAEKRLSNKLDCELFDEEMGNLKDLVASATSDNPTAFKP